MRIDLIVNGVFYHSFPYIGNEECKECDLAELCDSFQNYPCSLYAPSKVVFKRDLPITLKPSPKPSAGNRIRIIWRKNPLLKYNIGDILDVVSIWNSTIPNDKTYRIRVKGDRGRYKIINSKQYLWEIINK